MHKLSKNLKVVQAISERLSKHVHFLHPKHMKVHSKQFRGREQLRVQRHRLLLKGYFTLKLIFDMFLLTSRASNM